MNHSVYVFLNIATEIAKTEEFIKECIIAKQLDHPNVLGLVGVSIIKREALPLMIIPFMHNGDVKSFVKSKRGGMLEINDFPVVSDTCYSCNMGTWACLNVCPRAH